MLKGPPSHVEPALFARSVAPLPSKMRLCRLVSTSPWSRRYVPPALKTIVDPSGVALMNALSAAEASLDPVASMEDGTAVPAAVGVGVGAGFGVGVGVWVGVGVGVDMEAVTTPVQFVNPARLP